MFKHKKVLFFEFFILVVLTGIFFLFFTYVHKRPTVSVVISTYNMSKTLPRALNSILQQTLSDFELIVINDGSEDDTDEILQTYSLNDHRIKIISNEKNIGLIASLNKGLKVARGLYIARLDADDISYPNRLERQVAFMEKHHLDISAANYDRFGVRYSSRSTFSPEELNSDFLGFRFFFHNYFGHGTVIFRKDFLERKNLSYNPNRPNAEDFDLWLQFFMNGAKMGFMGGKPITTYNSSRHSPSWWKISDDSVIASKRAALKKIIPNFSWNDADLKPQNVSCDLLQQIIDGNKKTHFLHQHHLELFREKWCH